MFSANSGFASTFRKCSSSAFSGCSSPLSKPSIVSPYRVRISSSARVKSPDLAKPLGNFLVSKKRFFP
ncbi:Uncharacterised protein [Vibrio cholerae]|nr:Uncharacterised protein [Vibrio cholerae]CSC57966.1 Uncharacterised protein [Vibrio cholerae]